MPNKTNKNNKSRRTKCSIILFFLAALMGASIIAPLNIQAQVNQQVEVTHYGIFDWTNHKDFINSTSTDSTPVITTIEGRTVKVSILGFQHEPRASSVKELLGGGYVAQSNGIEHEIIIGDFQKNVGGLIINEMIVGAYAVYEDGSYAPATWYKNGFYGYDIGLDTSNYWCGTSGTSCTQDDVILRATPTKDNPIMVLNNLDTTYDRVLLRFDEPQRIKEYHFTYLQITDYKTMDLVGWTEDVNDPLTQYPDTAWVNSSISKTWIYTTTAGDFSPMFSVNDPSDTEPKWVNSISSSFNAGVEGLFDYPEILKKSSTYKDAGRSGTSTRDSATPAGMNPAGAHYEAFVASSNGGFDLLNAKWECYNEDSYICYASAHHPTLNQRVTSDFSARHWTPNENNRPDVPEWHSDYEGWCNHVNAGGTPCWKHEGRASNTIWDGSIYLWDIVTEDQKYVIDSTYYYQKYSNILGTSPVGGMVQVGSDELSNVTDINGNVVTNPVKGDDIASMINIYDEGVFKLYAKVTANLNKEITVNSELFYVDRTAPDITFDTAETGKWYTDTDLPNITVNLNDNLSGINTLRVMRYKSKDGINWVSDGTYDTVYDFGETDKTVRNDAKMNTTVSVDLEASEGYLYYRVKAIGEDIAGNTYDTVSPIYKYDGVPLISYKLEPKRYYDEKTGELNWTNKDINVTFSVADTESGLSRLQITRGDQMDVNVVAEVKAWPDKITNDQGFFVGSDFSDNVSYVQHDRILETDGYYVHVEDKNGNITSIPYIVDHIDRQAPKISWGNVDTGAWNKGTLSDITATITDDLSGVDIGEVKRYRSVNGTDWELMTTESNKAVWDGSNVGTTYDNPIREDMSVGLTVHMDPSEGYLYYKAEATITDIAGNKATYQSPVIKYDELPGISYTLEPQRLKSDNTLNWVNTDVNVKIQLTDKEVGVQAVCLANGTSWNNCIEVIQTWQDNNYHEDLAVETSYVEDTRTLQQDGLYLIVRDKVGNINSTPYIVDHIDKVPPAVNFSPDGYGPGKGPVEVTITVDDVPMQPDNAKSDVDEWSYCISTDSGVTWNCTEGLTDKKATVTIEETGYNLIKVIVTDKAGNKTESISSNYIIIGNPPTLIAKTDYYWVGSSEDPQEILKNCEAVSETDGVISDQIVISRITYQDGQIMDYPVMFRTDTAQTFVAEFEVTDSNGYTTRASQVYQVLKRDASDGGVDQDTTDRNNVSIYQRYVNQYKIAIQDNSYWNLKEEYKAALDEALTNQDVIDFEIVTRSR